LNLDNHEGWCGYHIEGIFFFSHSEYLD
jgi:hypothetical protein